jgi:hypothetical protein
MSKETQTIEIERCDVCHRESTIMTRTCIICGRDYCSFCEGVSGNVFRQDVCKECFKRKDVESVIEQYISLRYRPAREEQKVALKALPKISPKE